jgi:hypothetical protein
VPGAALGTDPPSHPAVAKRSVVKAKKREVEVVVKFIERQKRGSVTKVRTASRI